MPKQKKAAKEGHVCRFKIYPELKKWPDQDGVFMVRIKSVCVATADCENGQSTEEIERILNEWEKSQAKRRGK